MLVHPAETEGEIEEDETATGTGEHGETFFPSGRGGCPGRAWLGGGHEIGFAVVEGGRRSAWGCHQPGEFEKGTGEKEEEDGNDRRGGEGDDAGEGRFVDSGDRFPFGRRFEKSTIDDGEKVGPVENRADQEDAEQGDLTGFGGTAPRRQSRKCRSSSGRAARISARDISAGSA